VVGWWEYIMNDLIEAKLPKSYKWNDDAVIKETSPYIRSSFGRYCYFYPIEDDLYIKGMLHNYNKEKHKVSNIVVKLTNYKQLTATKAINILCQDVVIAHSMIFTVWKKLGLTLGLIQPVLRPLIQQNLQEA
jgi:hypothetical protein